MTTLYETSSVEPPLTGEDWAYEFVPSLIRGINVAVDSYDLDNEQALSAENLRIFKSEVTTDYGYTTFGQVIRGNPRATYEFYLQNNTSYLTLLTNATFYVWDGTVSEWEYVSDGTDTTTNGALTGGETSITVVDITGFSDGDHVGIALDDGTQHRTTINGTPSGSTIVITDAIPSASALGSSFVKAVDLNGDDDIGSSLITWPAQDAMYFANGIDTPKKFDGVTCTDVLNLPGSSFTCRLVTVFENYLLLLNTTESGTAYPQRVRWAEIGTDDNWNASVNFTDLYNKEDWITATQQVGPYNIIYKERSIIRQEFVGSVDQTWQFTPTIDAEGALNQDAVVNLGDLHVVFGNSNIYEYNGGFDLQPIGDNIYNNLFGQHGNLNGEFAARVFGLYVEETDEVWYFYPKGSDEFPKSMVKYKISSGSWTTREFQMGITGYGFFSTSTDLVWNQASGSWEAQDYTWVSRQTQANSPTIHLCGDDLQVYEYDYIASDDAGTAIPYEFITKDFYVPNRKMRTNRFEFWMKGTGITIEISLDRGQSYTTLGTFSPGAEFSRIRTWKQLVGRSVRFRFSGTSTFGIIWMGFTFKGESQW